MRQKWRLATASRTRPTVVVGSILRKHAGKARIGRFLDYGGDRGGAAAFVYDHLGNRGNRGSDRDAKRAGPMAYACAAQAR
jgi:hypothetical protein